jgi:hypothetical protein
MGVLACAPTGVLRPVAPFAAGTSREVGVSGIGARMARPGPETDRCYQRTCASGRDSGGVQIWYAELVRPGRELAAVGFAGDHDELGGGILFRGWGLDDDRDR